MKKIILAAIIFCSCTKETAVPQKVCGIVGGCVPALIFAEGVTKYHVSLATNQGDINFISDTAVKIKSRYCKDK